MEKICEEARNYANLHNQCRLSDAVSNSETARKFNDESLDRRAMDVLLPTWCNRNSNDNINNGANRNNSRGKIKTLFIRITLKSHSN